MLADQRILDAQTGWRAASPTPIAAWVVFLACSLLPTVIAQEVLGADVTLGQQAAATAIVVVVAFLVSLAVAPLHVLRPLLAVLLALIGSQWLVFGVLARADQIQELTSDPAFAVYMPAEVLLNLLVTSAMLVLLAVLKRDRRSFFLARGDLARSMAETRGMAWAWFIHFVQDVLIFVFMAGSAIVPEGG